MSANNFEGKFHRSNAKHWCSLCKVFIYNNKSCISKHEASPLHRSKVESAISASIAASSNVTQPKQLAKSKRAETPLFKFKERQQDWNVQSAVGRVKDWAVQSACESAGGSASQSVGESVEKKPEQTLKDADQKPEQKLKDFEQNLPVKFKPSNTPEQFSPIAITKPKQLKSSALSHDNSD